MYGWTQLVLCTQCSTFLIPFFNEFSQYVTILRIVSEGGTGEDRRINPPLNLGKTLIIFGKNWFCRSSPRLEKIFDPPLDKIRSALTEDCGKNFQFLLYNLLFMVIEFREEQNFLKERCALTLINQHHIGFSFSTYWKLSNWHGS